MRSDKKRKTTAAILSVIALLSVLNSNCTASEKRSGEAYEAYKNSESLVQVNLNNITINDFITLVSKAIGKNILVTQKISGHVKFISSSPIKKQELIDLLISVLDAKGYTLVDSGSYLKLVRTSMASKEGIGFKTSVPGVMRSVVLKIKNANADLVASRIRQFLSKGGKIITIRDINAIVIADYPKNLQTVKKIVGFIDQDPSSKMKIKFIRIKHAKASRIVPKIQKMAKSIANQKIPSNRIEVIDDDATNSVIVIASSENLSKLVPYIKKLDAEDRMSKQMIEVIPLENAEASEIVNTLNTLLSKKKYLKESDRPTISVDAEMNSIIVSARGEDIEMIRKMVKILDRERPQVYILAKIVEISESKAKQIGIKYGVEGGKLTSNALYTATLNLGGNPIASTIIGSSIGMSQQISEGIALGAFINFLSSEGAAEILSEPSILCVNNKESSIYVGKTESVLVSSVQGNATTDLARNTYKRQDIGLTLKIKPRISSKNKVTIKTTIIQEDVVGGQPGLPTTTKRQVETTAIVRNGESVILGGLIKSKYDDKETGVPILKDIPVAGNLFKNKEKIRDKVNLVVILTPFIVKSEKDMANLKKTLYRLNKLEEKYYEILREKLKVKTEKAEKKKREEVIFDVDSTF